VRAGGGRPPAGPAPAGRLRARDAGDGLRARRDARGARRRALPDQPGARRAARRAGHARRARGGRVGADARRPGPGRRAGAPARPAGASASGRDAAPRPSAEAASWKRWVVGGVLVVTGAALGQLAVDGTDIVVPGWLLVGWVVLALGGTAWAFLPSEPRPRG